MKTIFIPNSCSNKEQIGILPPPRTGIGSFPNVSLLLPLLLCMLCCRSASYKVHHHDVALLLLQHLQEQFSLNDLFKRSVDLIAILVWDKSCRNFCKGF
jgi:hypothetical protein